MIYLFQRIIQNHFQWTRPSPGRLGPQGEGKFVKENGFGFEDWNFNKQLSINNFIYGYCYYQPSEKKKNEKFNIAFATYSNKRWKIVGFYFESEFVEDSPISDFVMGQKINDLLQLGNSLGKGWHKLTLKAFHKKMVDGAQWINWKVKPDNVIRTEQPIIIPRKVLSPNNYRIVRPTEISKSEFNKLFYLATNSSFEVDYGDDTDFPEGKVVERMHKAKERNQAVIRLAKEQFKAKNRKLYCQVCGFDFFKKYGLRGLDFIEAHHVLPVSKLKKKSITKVSDIALVCSNCHRMLHRERPWLEMSELKDILKKRNIN